MSQANKRKSADAVAAESFRSGGSYPKAPSDLSEQEVELWNQIVTCRAVDFFKPGSLSLLKDFVRLVCVQDENFHALTEDPKNPTLIANVVKLSGALTTLGTKLRLTIQSASRVGEAKLQEEGPGQMSALLGGYAVEQR